MHAPQGSSIKRGKQTRSEEKHQKMKSAFGKEVDEANSKACRSIKKNLLLKKLRLQMRVKLPSTIIHHQSWSIMVICDCDSIPLRSFRRAVGTDRVSNRSI
jgi:hypothetical protein